MAQPLVEKLPIRWVILMAVTLALGFTLSVWGLGSYWLARRFLWYSQEWRMVAQIRMAWSNLPNDDGWGRAGLNCKSLEAQAQVKALSVAKCAARVLNLSGQPLAEPPFPLPVPPPSREEVDALLAMPGKDQHRHQVSIYRDKQSWMSILIPIRQNDQDIAILQFCSVWRETREVNEAMLSYLMAAALVALGASLVTAWWIAHWLSLPIKRLHQITQRFQQGDLKARTGLGSSSSRNEVYRVSASFDQMAGHIEESLLAQRRFVADASHELKTPLTAIGGMADMLKLSPDPEKQKRAIDIIIRETDRMSRLVADLLTLSKVEQAPTEPGLGRVCLSRLLREACEVVQAAHPERDIQVQVEEPLKLLGNPDELTRMLRNLLENAVKHTPPEAWIRASCRRQGRAIVVEISDNGPGIEAHDLPLLFDRFYRPDSSRARKTGGSGLGLAIVKSIAHRHGGQVEVRSQPGKGSSFQITFEELT